MKYFLGIDPGKSGAFAIIDENANIIEMDALPLIGKEYDKQGIKSFLKCKEFAHIGLENPGIIFGVAKSAMVSLNGCVRLIEGIIFGLNLPHTLVQPKEWQKEMFKHVPSQKKADGKNDPKATATLAAINIWPQQNFKFTNAGNPSKNYNDGMIDAVLIAEYVRRMYKSPIF